MRSVRFGLCAAIVAVAVVSSAGGASADAPALAPLKVLRHLSFDVVVGLETRSEQRVSGIGGPDSGIAADDASQTRKGTISADVVAVTADGGIVVDISEDTDNRKAAVARVGIQGNKLVFDANRDLTVEETDVLRFLSRGFVKDGEVAAGTMWTSDVKNGGGSETGRYTVTAVDADAKTIDVAIAVTMVVNGPNGFDGTTSGTLKYDLATLVPLAFTLHTRQVTRGMGTVATIDTNVTSTLGADSFRKPAGS
jgi:hypothetical protein